MAPGVFSGSLPIPYLNPVRAFLFRKGVAVAAAAALCGLPPAAGQAARAADSAPSAPAADWEKYATPKADSIAVYKSARLLQLTRKGQVIRSYHVALGRHPIGQKLEEGDGRTPEGTYFIDKRDMASKYHLALHISYPQKADIARSAAAGVSPGGNILIHGEPNILNEEGKAHLLKDWTAGCIALKNRDVDEIWRLVDDGVTVNIYP